MAKKPVLLCIMDGFGWVPGETYGNAVVAAKTPHLDALMAKYPMTTIEASGIGIACIVASCFHVPVVFAKKSKSVNIDGAVYVAEVESFTHKCKNQVIVSKKFLHPEDKVLIIDDFLANGCALQGLISIVTQAGATVEGIGIAVEKGFQQGGRIIRNLGYPLESLAIVESMDASNGTIVFREQEQ